MKYVRWLRRATDDELSTEREKVRKIWASGGKTNMSIREADRLYHILHDFNNEMSYRSNLKYDKENPNAKTRYREHGWYLPNDD